jgi:hypothetical protein
MRGVTHFSAPRPSLQHASQPFPRHFSQVSHAVQPRLHPGKSGQNSSHFTSKQYFLTFSIPQTNRQTFCWQAQAHPQLAQRFADPWQPSAPHSPAVPAWPSSKLNAMDRDMPTVLMLISSLDRLVARVSGGRPVIAC